MNVGAFKGFREWWSKIEEIAALGLPEDDFYVHLQGEALELSRDRNDGEMGDVLNLIAMCYVVGDYKVNFEDCLSKLKAREQKYEVEKQHPRPLDQY